jgi:hypothetical protein
MLQLSNHLLVNTQMPKQSEYIDVKLAIQNSSALRPSFTLDAVGHLFTHQLQMMQLRYLKIARSLLVSALKFDVPVAIRI